MEQTTLDKPGGSQNAKFAFFYMLSLVALIFMAVATGTIVFQMINKKIVDVLSYQGGFNEGALKFAISAIIIAAPIYFITSWFINKNLTAGKLNKDAGVRKWLTYFILFVAAVVMISWLIATIFSFLNGDLTAKFILKTLTAIFIAAAIFSYYLYDIRRMEIMTKNPIIRIYFFGSLVIVLAALITSFFFISSPTEVRNQKHDQALLERFNQIDSAVNSYYNDYKKLPDNLTLLVGSPYYLTEQTTEDPLTNVKFDYKIKTKDSYELCATFKTASVPNDTTYPNYYDVRWQHQIGYQCLTQKVTLLPQKSFVPTP